MNRKAEGFDLGRKSVYYLLVLLIIAVLFVYLGGVLTDYSEASIKYSGTVTNNAIAEKLVYCISENTGDVLHRGKIDSAKFTDKTIEECLKDEEYFKGRVVKLTIGKKAAKQGTEYESTKYGAKVWRMVDFEGKPAQMFIEVEMP